VSASGENTRRPPSFWSERAAALLLLVGGVAAGLLVAALGEGEIRWLLALVLAIAFLCICLVLPFRQRFLWGLFIFSFQLLDPAVRLFYGRAGTDGLMITATFMVGAVLVSVMLLSGNFGGPDRIRWGGALALPVLSLLVIAIFSTLQSEERFAGLISIATALEQYFIFLIGVNCVRTERHLSRTLTALFLVLGTQCLVYYYECVVHVSYISITGETFGRGEGILERPGGTVGHNPFSFTNFILPLIFIVIADRMPVPKQRGPDRRFAGILVPMAMVALALTLTRSAWISFILGALWLAFWGYRRRVLSIRKLAYMGGLAAVVALAAAPLISARLQQSPLQSSYDERVALMKMALRVIQANPVFGVGPGAYLMSYRQYLTPELAEKWQSIVHNAYLLRTAETGIPGGIMFIVVMLVVLRQCIRLSRSQTPAIRTLAFGTGANIVSMWQLMYWDPWTHVPAQQLFWFLAGLVIAASRIERTTTIIKKVSQQNNSIGNHAKPTSFRTRKDA